MITFDSYAWMEYLNGTEKGEIARHYIEADGIIFTPTICLAEIKASLLRKQKPEKIIEKAITQISSRSMILPLDSEIALKAAEFKDKGLYLVDAIIYASALRHNTKLLSGNQHFKDYEHVEFLA